MTNKKAILCLSGGQDSVTALGWALKEYEQVYTIAFNYGQRHEAEMKCRKNVLATIQNVLKTNSLRDDLIIDLTSFGQLSHSALTTDSPIEMDKERGLPTVFTPGRNLIFATYASIYAFQKQAHDVILGVSQLDYTGFPDCREETIKPLQEAITKGMAYEINLITPFMFCDKASEWQLAEKVGGEEFVQYIVENSHTCYNGNRTKRFDWGYGCGECPACKVRSQGWEKYLENKKA